MILNLTNKEKERVKDILFITDNSIVTQGHMFDLVELYIKERKNKEVKINKDYSRMGKLFRYMEVQKLTTAYDYAYSYFKTN